MKAQKYGQRSLMTSGRSSSDCYGLTTDASHHGADRAPRQGYRSVFGVSEFGLPRSLRRASMCQPGAQIDPLQITIGARHRHLPTPWCLIERPDLLARETGTRKFVTRVQVMLNSAAIAWPFTNFRDVSRPAPRGRCRRTQTRLHHTRHSDHQCRKCRSDRRHHYDRDTGSRGLGGP